MAVTYDASDTSGGYFSGFSQSFDVSLIMVFYIKQQMLKILVIRKQLKV